MITTPDYGYAALCHALAGFVIWIMFWTNDVLLWIRCYVRVECSARLERRGCDQDT